MDLHSPQSVPWSPDIPYLCPWTAFQSHQSICQCWYHWTPKRKKELCFWLQNKAMHSVYKCTPNLTKTMWMFWLKSLQYYMYQTPNGFPSLLDNSKQGKKRYSAKCLWPERTRQSSHPLCRQLLTLCNDTLSSLSLCIKKLYWLKFNRWCDSLENYWFEGSIWPLKLLSVTVSWASPWPPQAMVPGAL